LKFSLFFTYTEKAYDLDLLFLREWKHLFDVNPYFIICPLALFGMFIAYKNRTRTLPLMVLIFSQLLFTLIFYLNHRHRVTVLPFMIIFEAYTLIWITERLQSKDFKKILLLFGLTIVFLLAFKPVKANQNDIDFYKHSKLGFIYQKKGLLKDAKRECLQALSIHPSDTNSIYNLANNYFLENNFQMALKHYNAVLSIYPYHVDSLFNKAITLEKLGKLDKSLKTYEKVIQIEKNSIDAYFNIARIYQIKGNCQKANLFFSLIIKTDPNLIFEVQKIAAPCNNQ